MDTNNELHATKVSASINPITGTHHITPTLDKIEGLTDEEIKEMIESSDSPDQFLSESIMGTLSGFVENNDHKELLEFNKLINDYRYGKVDKIRFKDLPRQVKEIARQNIGTDPKALGAFTAEYVKDMIDKINEEASRKIFSHDIDTGEGKTYDDLYMEQFETFAIGNTEEGESSLYKTFIDAINFETLSAQCKKNVPRYRKHFKHMDRLEKSYEHIYSAKRTSMVSLSPANIPYIIDRHFVHNEIKGYDFIHYQLLELVFLNYVINERGMSVSNLDDHMFMYMTLKAIYDLDYLDKEGEIYPKTLKKIVNMVEDISKLYEISTLK